MSVIEEATRLDEKVEELSARAKRINDLALLNNWVNLPPKEERFFQKIKDELRQVLSEFSRYQRPNRTSRSLRKKVDQMLENCQDLLHEAKTEKRDLDESEAKAFDEMLKVIHKINEEIRSIQFGEWFSHYLRYGH
jgi:hypothetical protein